MIGQNVRPRGYEPMVDTLDPAKVMANLDDIRKVVGECATAMPLHQEFIDRNCSAFANA
jgi:tryptophan halogenase